MTYDPLGRFHWIANGALHWMQYDGADLIEERNAGGVLRRYVHGPGADEPLVWYEGSGTSDRRFLHADERGSVVAFSDSAGNAIAINKYDEYGAPQAGNIGRFQYTGQAWLRELSLYYYKARMYDPKLGRFMQTDPIGCRWHEPLCVRRRGSIKISCQNVRGHLSEALRARNLDLHRASANGLLMDRVARPLGVPRHKARHQVRVFRSERHD